jgi:hypothetical protein
MRSRLPGEDLPVADRAAIDLEHAIAGLELGLRGLAAIEDVADHRRGQHGVAREEDEVDDHRQDEVRGGAREHDDEPLPQWTPGEAAAGIGTARGGIGLDPENADVTADRERADLVLGLAELEPHQRPAVAQREPEHLDVEQFRRGEVAELVDHDEHTDE